MKKFFKQLFCKHKYEKYLWYEEFDKERNERYSTHLYKCNKCGKEVLVDARYEHYSRII